MTTDRKKSNEHFERILLVRRYIREHLDEPLSRKELAHIAGFSEVHFHRIFTAYIGESLSEHVRRLRMERAARQLLHSDASIVDVALAYGYSSHSAFSKVFREFYHISPSEYRELSLTAAAHIVSRRIPFNYEEKVMEPKEIRTFPAVEVLYARATETLTTPAFQTAPGEAFGKLHGYLHEHDLSSLARRYLALYPDAAELGATLRFDAAVVFAEGVKPEAGPGMAYQTIPGGRWAVFTHVGPYDMLWKSWQDIYRDWLPTSGEEVRDMPSYEDYVDDPDAVEPDEMRTDLYVPLK